MATTRKSTGRGKATAQQLAKDLKDHFDALERLREYRAELKSLLARDDLSTKEELDYAKTLFHVAQTIETLESDRAALCEPNSLPR
jgi:hypothetical protein